MSARGRDLIWWSPLGGQITTYGPPALIHWCPQAVTHFQTRRDQLDPMALGNCRYCREPLPTPPTRGTGSFEC